MKYIFPLVAVIALVGIAWLGTLIPGSQYIFGIVVPYAAMALFIGGFVRKVLDWGKSPVPFKITTTCGQGESLPWIKQEN